MFHSHNFPRFSKEVRAKLEDEDVKVAEETIDTVRSSDEITKARKCFNFICSIEPQEEQGKQNVKSDEDLAREASEFLKEEPKYRR